MSLNLHSGDVRDDGYDTSYPGEGAIDQDNYSEFFAFRKVIPDADEEYEFYILFPKRISIKMEQSITTFVIPEGGFKAAHLFKVDGNVRSFEFVFEVHNIEDTSTYVGRDGAVGSTLTVIRPQQFRDWYFDNFENKGVDEQFYIDIYDFVAENNRYERKYAIRCLPETPSFDMDVDNGPFYNVTMPFKQGGQFSEFNVFEDNPNAPKPPSRFRASVRGRTITLNWDPPRLEEGSFEGYDIRYREIGEGRWRSIKEFRQTTLPTSDSITVTEGGTYLFQMRTVVELSPHRLSYSLWTGTVSVGVDG